MPQWSALMSIDWGQDLDNYNWIRDAEKEQAGEVGTQARILYQDAVGKNEYRPSFQ